MENVPSTMPLYNHLPDEEESFFNTIISSVNHDSEGGLVNLIITDIKNDWNEDLELTEPIPNLFNHTLERGEFLEKDTYKLFINVIEHDLVEGFKNIVFMMPKPRRILPPIVSATVSDKYKDNRGRACYVLKVNCFIIAPFDKSKGIEEIKKNLNVSLKSSWDGMSFAPKFLISTDLPNTTKDVSWKAIQLAFALKVPVKPSYVTAYLWDVDPEGSRGTETTVQDDDD
jgi:hypothetical protein